MADSPVTFLGSAVPNGVTLIHITEVQTTLDPTKVLIIFDGNVNATTWLNNADFTVAGTSMQGITQTSASTLTAEMDGPVITNDPWVYGGGVATVASPASGNLDA